MNATKFWIGIDMGGTKILTIIMDNDMHIIGRAKRIIETPKNNERVTAIIIECTNAAIQSAGINRAHIAGIGLASAGIVNVAKGIIEFTPNLNLSNLPIGDILQKEFGVPVLLENDVNAGTYGEFLYGTARGSENVIGLFVGTGLGGGIIVNKKLYVGSQGCAAEIGHMVVQSSGHRCSCGKYGCLEAYASRRAIAKEVIGLAIIGEAPSVLSSVGTDITKINSSVLYTAIKAQEQPVIDVVTSSARYLGIGIANCVSIFNPDMVVLGGGLIEKLGKWYIDIAEESMRRHLLHQLSHSLEVRKAELGDDAVCMGSIGLVREQNAK